MIVTSDGHLYLSALEDVTVGTHEPLSLIRGKYKVGQQAKALMEEGKQWYLWALRSDQELVCCTTTPAFATKYPQNPLPLSSFLKYLETNGKVKVQLITHDLTKDPASNTWHVQATETVVLASGKADCPANVQSLAGNLVDPSFVKDSSHLQVVHRLTYVEAKHQIESGLPGIHLKRPIRLPKGSLVCLA